MTSLRALIGRELEWRQEHAFKMEYDLRHADELVATLRFKSSLGSLATAECADGCWTFKRVGFWQTRVTIRACGNDADLGFFKNGTWANGGTLEMADGRRYRASNNAWLTKYDLATESGESLLNYTRIGGIVHSHANVMIQPSAGALLELPWLVALGWYLAIMMQRDAAAVSVVVH